MGDFLLFKEKVNRLITDLSLMKATLSKPRPNNKDWLNVFIEFNGNQKFKLVKRTKTQDFTSMCEVSELSNSITELLTSDFYNADVFSDNKHFSLLQSKKGKATLIEKKNDNPLTIKTSHDNKKKYAIDADLPFLKILGIVSENGKVFAPMQKKYRQINKFIEIFCSTLGLNHHSLTIADMGSGKAYLSFALYHYLNNVCAIPTKITGYEIRQDLIDQCNDYAKSCGFDGLTFEKASIDEAQLHPGTNVVIALHACDIATDMAIAKGLQCSASAILLSPCCHKQIRKEMKQKDDITKHGILEERMAEMITDTIRSLIMEQHGYETKIFEFINQEHTGKNLMITALKNNKKIDNLERINKLKNQYGIATHYLETLVK